MSITKITRTQQRRGLHKNLPIPLFPGEFGLATDTRELFIGNDVSDSLGGVYNRTVQINNTVGGYSHVNSILKNNIVEFIVKRTIINGPGNIFSIQKVHPNISLDIETGINERSLIVYKYSYANSNYKRLVYGDIGSGGEYTIDISNDQITLHNPIVANDRIYVIYLNRKDLEKYLINAFNLNFDLLSNSINDSHLEYKLSTDQLYFDESTGEGFVGFNFKQVNDNYNTTGSNTDPDVLGSNQPIKVWFEEWIKSENNIINAAFNALGSDYHSGDNSLTGGNGIARFGQDNSTSIPNYFIDNNLGFQGRSHVGAINLSNFLNQSWLREGSEPTT